MTVVPACRLSHSDLSLLGSNVSRAVARERRRHHVDLAAVNRSLDGHGEAVDRLFSPRRKGGPAGPEMQPACL